jgi:hypothetical protein
MTELDASALQYVFPAEWLRYFSIVESGIKTDEPTGSTIISARPLYL